ncbi:uncharacterized protein LOC112575805 isoform X2 [Pomacea canaliculata]|uniref:uncharacterized protein LOC112575805 isoform X2 n=1 Tax=Pomacea canaliculata TaxID=400727 RepID=UPI000D728778|nr:uncharacterized protein LOC112575805 isoform X2 [Pomacea canaliculata]
MEVRNRLILLATALISLATVAVTQLNVHADSPVVQAGASGSDVVDAVVDLIDHSCIFPDDYLFLRRLAYLETEDGKAPNTYMMNTYYNGIWRTNKDMFMETQQQSSPALLEAHRKIEAAFGINWQSVRWEDLQKPLYSALAAKLYITYRGLQIPSSPNDQISFWLSNFPSGGLSTIGWENTCSGTEQADVVFVIDSATSSENFRYMQDYLQRVVYGLPVDNGNVRVALYQIGGSSIPHRDFSLGTNLIKSSIMDTISWTSQIYSLTSSAPDIGSQLQPVLGEAFASSAQRPNAAKILVLVTDKHQSNLISMQTARDMATAEGVSVFTVGVGDEALMTSLAHVATQPECDHQIRVDQFVSLSSIAQQTQFKICREPMIALGGVRCRLDQCRNIAFPMTSPQMTVRAATNCSSGIIYVSTRSPRPTGSFWDAEDLVVDATSNAAHASVSGSSPYVYATFTEVILGASSCYAVIEAYDGLTTPSHPQTIPTIYYPDPNPCQALGRTEDRFAYPFNTRMFIQCDLQDRMYLTICPPEVPTFDPNCKFCVGPSVPSLARCTQGTNDLCGLSSNPCTKYNLLNNNYFFACPRDSSEYLQCDPWGNPHVQSCPSSAVWQQDQLSCVFPQESGLCVGSSQYVPDPADPHSYYLCYSHQAYHLTCYPPTYIWNQMSNSCQTFTTTTTTATTTTRINGVDRTLCTPENIAADRLYFPYAEDETKYIQCDLWGDAFLKSCQPGFRFLPESSTCV